MATATRSFVMPAYVLFEVEIRDAEKWKDFSLELKPVLAAAGAKYLVRGGVPKTHDGDWNPQRLSILEFPSRQALEDFYEGSDYQRLIRMRQEFSSARFVSVDGLPYDPSSE
jgi:uncharacterized protein (DUF1330 family)